MTQRNRITKIALVIACCIMIGGPVYAATNIFFAQEIETGTRSGNTSVVSDTSAANGSTVIFTDGEQAGGSTCPHRFPTPDCVGLPSGWTSTATYTSDQIISADNAVVENITMDGAVLYVTGDNVTVRKVKFINGAGISTSRNDYCAVNTVIEDSTFTANGADWLASGLDATIQDGGYTARRVYMDGVYEGLRIGGRVQEGNPCGSVAIEKSYIRASYPPLCPSTSGWDWHGDGLQFYDGQYSSVTDSVIFLDGTSGVSECFGTAPYFLADQCNTGRSGSPPWTTTGCSEIQPWYNNTLAAHGGVMADVDGLIVAGGSYAFRTYMPTRVKDLYIKNNDWVYGPVDAACSDVTAGWDAHMATIDGNGQPVSGAAIACSN